MKKIFCLPGLGPWVNSSYGNESLGFFFPGIMEGTGYCSAVYIIGLHWCPVQQKGENGKWVYLIQILGNQGCCLRVTSQQVCGNTPPWKKIHRSPRVLLYIRVAFFSSVKNVRAPAAAPQSSSVFREGTENYYVTLDVLAFISSHRSSQALMRWLSLSSEVQLSFESMVPWPPHPLCLGSQKGCHGSRQPTGGK